MRDAGTATNPAACSAQPLFVRPAMPTIAHLISLAGGRIICARCTAMSKRTKEQCGRPSLRTSTTQKCLLHGGRGSGPKTAEGRQRIAQAHTVHGRETRQIRQERSRSALRLAHLEDILHVMGMTTATRSRGRKPSGYCPIKTIAQARAFLLDTTLNPTTGRHD